MSTSACAASPAAPEVLVTDESSGPAVDVEASAPAPAAAAEPDAQPPTPLPAVKLPPEVAEILAARSVWWLSASTRLAIARRGAVRLEPEGPDLGLDDDAKLPEAKRLWVVEDGERPRVVIDDGGVRLLVYVDRADAQPVLTRDQPLRPSPGTQFGHPPRKGHVVLRTGAWVDTVATKGDRVQVAYGGPPPRFTGWVDADALATSVHLAEDAPAEDPETTAPRAWVTRRATKLRATPGGKTLVEIGAEAEVVAITARTQAGHRLVEFEPGCENDLRFVGFVRAADLFQPNYGFGHGCGHGSAQLEHPWGDAESAPRVELPAGRFVLDPDATTVVGCLREAMEAADLGEGLYALPTIWGPIPVRLAAEDLEGTCAP